MSRTPAANAALIIALNPLVSSLVAAGLLGDRLTRSRIAGVVLGFGSVVAVVLNRPGAALGSTGLSDALLFGSVRAVDLLRTPRRGPATAWALTG